MFIFLIQVFPRYGKTTNIEVDHELGRGFITFENLLDAFKAKVYLNGHKLPRDKASLEVIFVQTQKTVEPAPVEEAKNQFPANFSSFQQPMQTMQNMQPLQSMQAMQPQFNYYQTPGQFFPPMPESAIPSTLAMATPFTPSVMQLPKSPKRQKAYYEVYDPYQTEED